MNRESVPLIVGLIVPILLVFFILLYYFGYDITEIFRRVDLIYYIIIIPFVLGFTVVIIKLVKRE